MSEPNPSAFSWKYAALTHRGYLPHVRQENVVYFVTFRLADSLPAERVTELLDQRTQWLRRNPLPHSPQQIKEYRQIWTVPIENLLDAGHGECVLKNAACREVLEASMRHDDGSKYQLGEYVIMPNHVHALVHALPNYELAHAMKAWKSVSARRIGKLLGRTGSFWMDEYFDHAVRDEAHLEKFTRYIRENPRGLPSGSFTLGTGKLQSGAGALTGDRLPGQTQTAGGGTGST
jgi:REP element-mobilizing transposase RayT